MKTWLLGVAVLAICAGGVALSINLEPSGRGVDTTIENLADNLALNDGEPITLDATDKEPPSGLDNAIEQRQANLFICMDADADTVVQLSREMSQAGRNYAAVAKRAGCAEHEDPAPFSGPMASANRQFGRAHRIGEVSYIAGEFGLWEPAGTGISAKGIARWDHSATAATGRGAVPLEAYLDFSKPAECQPDPRLAGLRASIMNDEGINVGPYRAIEVRKVGPDADDITRRIVPLVGSWHGLPLREIRFVGTDDTGFNWMEFVFDAPPSVVGVVTRELGFGVRKAGDVVDKDFDGPSLMIALTTERSATILTCGLLT